MATTNQKTQNKFTEVTHEGAPASRMTPLQALRRSVLSCLLWENEFYESGATISARIMELSAQVKIEKLAELAIEAREVSKLRHVPLLLLVALCKHGSGNSLVSKTIARVIQRADELAELVALYWSINGKDASLSKQLRLGLAQAFTKFDAYQLGKYNRDKDVKLRDVLFLSHAKAKDDAQADVFKKLAEQTLESPDTWEVALSAGKDKKTEFTRLIETGQLGYMALLRNLRGMTEAGVDRSLIINAIEGRKGADRVLPFRYTAAARAAPSLEPFIDSALVKAIAELPKMSGRTLVLVDVSGSMDRALSAKSDLTRADAAATLAAIIPSDDLRIYSFSYDLVEVPARKGMAGVEAVLRSQPHSGTHLIQSVREALQIPHDRIIVITDEQAAADTTRLPAPVTKNSYIINVASNKNGVGYGKWRQIDGFSENVLRFIQELEASDFPDGDA